MGGKRQGPGVQIRGPAEDARFPRDVGEGHLDHPCQPFEFCKRARVAAMCQHRSGEPQMALPLGEEKESGVLQRSYALALSA